LLQSETWPGPLSQVGSCPWPLSFTSSCLRPTPIGRRPSGAAWLACGFAGGTEPFVYLMTEGEQPVGAIFQSDEAGSGPIVYMATDDIDATITKVRAAGASAAGNQPIPQTGWFARCKDTEGNTFSLFQVDESVPGDF